MENSKIEITLSGSGGQGLILAGFVLAEAAGIIEGKEVVQTVMYGPEARLGTSRSDVIISETHISYPKVVNPDILVVLSQGAYDKFKSIVKNKGIIVADTTFVNCEDKENIIKIPFTQIARERIGTPLVANMMVLAYISRKFKLVKHDSLIEAVKRRVKEKYIELNLRALEEGNNIGENTPSY